MDVCFKSSTPKTNWEKKREEKPTQVHTRATGSILKQQMRGSALPSDRLGQGKLVPRHRSPMISSRRPNSSQWPGQTAASSRVWEEQTEEHKHITLNLPHPSPPVKTTLDLDWFNFLNFWVSLCCKKKSFVLLNVLHATAFIIDKVLTLLFLPAVVVRLNPAF